MVIVQVYLFTSSPSEVYRLSLEYELKSIFSAYKVLDAFGNAKKESSSPPYSKFFTISWDSDEEFRDKGVDQMHRQEG